MQMIDRPCPACRSTDQHHVFADASYDLDRLDAYAFASRKMPEYMHYRLIVCPECDLLYASPVPRAESLARAYQEAAFDSGEEAGYAARTYARLVAGILPNLPDRAAALDVGTGDGVFLRHLLNFGFQQVIGVEPSAAPIAAAEAGIRPLIRHELFQAENFPARSLSLLTCFQTLEHLPDPITFCTQARQLLKPGGAICLVIHNRRAFSARVLGLKSPIFDIEHLQLFSPRSIERLLVLSGFANVRVRSIVNRYPLHYWAKLFPLPTAIKPAFIRTLKRTGIGRILLPLPAGNMVAIGYCPS